MSKMPSSAGRKFTPWLFIFVALLFFAPAGCGQPTHRDPLTKQERAWLNQHDGKIMLAHDPSAKPIEFLDEKGKFQGMAADYIHRLEELLRFKFKIVHLKTWPQVIEKAKQRQVDVLCAFTANPDRKKWMLFTQPYIVVPAVILTRKDVEGPLTLEKLKGKKVTYTKGWVIDEYLHQNYKHLDFLPAPTENQAMNLVSTGQAHAWVTALTTAAVQVFENKITNLYVAGNTGFSFKLAMASRKDWPILNRILSKGLAQITQEEKSAIFNKWVQLERKSIFLNKQFWIVVSVCLGALVVIFLFFMIWNMSLRRQVAARTQELTAELTRKTLAEQALRQSEGNLRVSETRLRLALEAANAGTWEWELAGNKNTWSSELFRLYDLDRGETEPSHGNWLASIVPEDRESVKAALKSAVEKADELNIEWRVNTRDGSTRWLMSRGQPQNGPDGAIIKYHGIVIDITERKLAEEALKESKLFLENLSDIAYIADAAGNLVWANSYSEKVIGLPLDRVLGRPFLPLFVESDHASLIEVYQRTLKGESLQNTLTFTSGAICHFTSQPRFNNRGEIIGTFGIARDITERITMEKALKTNEERLKKAQAVAKIGNWEYDLAGGMVWGSEEYFRLFGWERANGYAPRKEVESRLVDPKKARQALEDLVNKGLDYDLELQIKRSDIPHPITIRSIAEVLPDSRGNPVKVVGVIHDITELKARETERIRLNEQLRQSQKMDALGTLASGIAHDFNNVLTAVQGYTELSLDDLPQGHPVAENLLQINKAADRAKNLVRQILTFSRKADNQKRPLSLNLVAEEAVSVLARTVPKMIRLKTDLGGDIKPIMADFQQIEQVIFNLVSNAADAIAESGAITISTRNETVDNRFCRICGKNFAGQFVVLRVNDTGQGISPENMDKIFDPFFTTKGVGEGTGLGLSTVFGTVAQHEGHISFESLPGAGTTFCIFLPAARGAEEPDEPDRESAEHQTTGSETILVVDDEAAVRDIATRMLTRNGYQVLTAASGEQALKVYRQEAHQIHAVILDLGMPGMGGKACLKELRAQYPQARVMVASGYIQYELGNELEELGATGMVSKPYRQKELLTCLRQVLAA